MAGGITFRQEPLPPGWIYPCTEEDIRRGLDRLPYKDYSGVTAIKMVPVNPGNRFAYATYYGSGAVVEIPAVRNSMTFKFDRHATRGRLIALCSIEIAYGMEIEGVGDRWVSHWTRESLCKYIAEHVLAHEVGHHVIHQKRKREGMKPCPGHDACEQIAENYALRNNPVAGVVLTSIRYNKMRCHRWPTAVRRPRLAQQGRQLYPSQRGNYS